MKQRFLSSFSALVLATAFLMPAASHAAVTTAFSAGDLIKGSGSTVYYFASNGKRYVFPNEKTYFTWYKDFSTVVQIPDNVLAAIGLGGNITYRPGYKMVKITTDPRVYVVDQGGMLRHVTSVGLAETLFGLSWKSRIDDIPDAFFVNYRVGDDITTANQYNPADIMTLTSSITQDKQFNEKTLAVSIGGMDLGFVPASTTVKVGTTVTWTNNDSTTHTVHGDGIESLNLEPGQTFSYTFRTAGSFSYHCTIHPSMLGTINVVN